MVVEESRILQVTIFETLQNNPGKVDFSTVLLDVMTHACSYQLRESVTRTACRTATRYRGTWRSQTKWIRH